jgi:hypothetical protein
VILGRERRLAEVVRGVQHQKAVAERAAECKRLVVELLGAPVLSTRFRHRSLKLEYGGYRARVSERSGDRARFVCERPRMVDLVSDERDVGQFAEREDDLALVSVSRNSAFASRASGAAAS